MTSLKITDDIDALVQVFPPDIAAKLYEADRFEDLVEVIMDLGRPCEARYTDAEVLLTEREITQNEIDSVVDAIGTFGDDNRAGIERTLHRISAIRNRHGNVIGLTCRVGRAVYGTIDIIRDIVESGKSVLLLGRPGVGKTTMLREVARVLAEKKRVVIVDTSNEIGGDGDIPHPAVGRARRMQVMTPSLQHAVMIEAVENHMPQVIVIDEIGTELEAAAARTIAERGVQLVGTAHGNTLDNLMRNPTLNDLVGGIQTVTLSDDEARRRGTQKSVLERKAPPTFDIVVEIQERERVAIRQDVTEAVDAILRGRSLPVTVRVRRPNGEIESIEQEPERPATKREAKGGREAIDRRLKKRSGKVSPLRIYPYGLNQTRIKQTGRHLGLPVVIVNDLLEADALFTLRTYYRKRPPIVSEAERKGIPIYVLRNNTAEQIESYLVDLFALERSPDEDTLGVALEEAQRAIDQVATGAKNSVQLVPQSSYVRRMQHQLIRESDLLSRSSGVEPRRRVTVYRGN